MQYSKKSRSGEKLPEIVSTSSSGLPKWRQSPINLSRVATWSKKYAPLYLTNYWSDDGYGLMINTGKTVSVELLGKPAPYVRGGPLAGDEYQFANLRFRWGPLNSHGAEHSIDGIWNSMEAQMMHWNTRYGSLEKCYDKSDGLMIFSFLMQVVGCSANRDNQLLADITDNLWKIKVAGSSVEIPADCLTWMSEACKASGYYTYSGSLTTFPYSECVRWIILPSIIKLSSRQIEEFRTLYTPTLEHIVRNYRSQQNLHRRRIFYVTENAPANG